MAIGRPTYERDRGPRHYRHGGFYLLDLEIEKKFL
jgi:hypothetical protein